MNSEREEAIKEYQAGKYHGCVQEVFAQNCGLCLYRFSCKHIKHKEAKKSG